jgi:hypothetical protein
MIFIYCKCSAHTMPNITSVARPECDPVWLVESHSCEDRAMTVPALFVTG